MPWPKPNLTTYAANAVLHHLRQIDVSQVPLKDQTRIVTLLYLLITDSESITRWLSGLSSLSDFFNALLGDRTMTQVLQTWLMQEKAQTSLDEADKHWIKAAGVSIAVLLKPMANASASQWLTVKSGIERVKFSIAFLHTYDSLVSSAFLPIGYCCALFDPRCASTSPNNTSTEDRSTTSAFLHAGSLCIAL